MALLEISRLRKSFAGAPVLDIGPLQLARGQLTLLLGANGAGKTTLLRILAGLLDADGGAQLRWDGAAVSALRPGRHATYLHQQPYLLKRSVRANIAYALRAGGADPQRARQILAQAQLAGLADRPIAELSYGQQRQVAVARTYASAAPLVLLDEPAANLDQAAAQTVSRLIEGLAAAQRCVVVAAAGIEPPAGLPYAQLWQMRAGRISAD